MRDSTILTRTDQGHSVLVLTAADLLLYSRQACMSSSSVAESSSCESGYSTLSHSVILVALCRMDPSYIPGNDTRQFKVVVSNGFSSFSLIFFCSPPRDSSLYPTSRQTWINICKPNCNGGLCFFLILIRVDSWRYLR